MSLPHVILGFLNYSPATGYDLKKTFDATVKHFWPADQSQIYRTLTRLVDEGAVVLEEIPQSGKPGRKLYHITEQGKSELMRWLRESRPAEKARNPSLIQVFFGGNLEDEEMLSMLNKAAADLEEELSLYGRIHASIDEIVPFTPADRDKFFWMLTLDYGVAMTSAELAWVKSIISRLRRRKHASPEAATSKKKSPKLNS